MEFHKYLVNKSSNEHIHACLPFPGPQENMFFLGHLPLLTVLSLVSMHHMGNTPTEHFSKEGTGEPSGALPYQHVPDPHLTHRTRVTHTI